MPDETPKLEELARKAVSNDYDTYIEVLLAAMEKERGWQKDFFIHTIQTLNKLMDEEAELTDARTHPKD